MNNKDLMDIDYEDFKSERVTRERVIFSEQEIAVSPLPQENSQKITGSISSLMSKNEDLKPLRVVFYSLSDFQVMPGDEVFLKPESYSAPYMNMVYQINGTKFILIPKAAVIAVSKK